MTAAYWSFLICFPSGWAKKGEDAEKKISGTIEIPNLSEEHSPKDVDVNIEVTKDTSNTAFALKNFLRSKGTEKIREKLGQYITDLQNGK